MTEVTRRELLGAGTVALAYLVACPNIGTTMPAQALPPVRNLRPTCGALEIIERLEAADLPLGKFAELGPCKRGEITMDGAELRYNILGASPGWCSVVVCYEHMVQIASGMERRFPSNGA